MARRAASSRDPDLLDPLAAPGDTEGERSFAGRPPRRADALAVVAGDDEDGGGLAAGAQQLHSVLDAADGVADIGAPGGGLRTAPPARLGAEPERPETGPPRQLGPTVAPGVGLAAATPPGGG